MGCNNREIIVNHSTRTFTALKFLLSFILFFTSVSSAITAEEYLKNPSKPVHVDDTVKTSSLSLSTTELNDFSMLLGNEPLATLDKKAKITLYEPPNPRGIVIVAPGSEGVRDDILGQHIRQFLRMHQAVLVVDSYKIRGFSQELPNQAAVFLPSQVLDLGLAIKLVQHSSNLQRLPIGLFGTSRGGLAITLLLDERVFKALQIEPNIAWACVLYPSIHVAYEKTTLQPLKIPFLYVVAEKDDEISPQVAIAYGSLIKNINPAFQIKIWPNAVHLFDAPFQKFFLKEGFSLANAPLILINTKGDYIALNQKFKTWPQVLNWLKSYLSAGIWIGYNDNNLQSIFPEIQTFVESVVPTVYIKTDVVVVGAGYSGLVAAKTIADKGYHVVIMEARDRVGGRAYSVKLAPGVTADLGAGWIISPTHKHILELAKTYHINLYPSYISGDALIEKNEGIIDRVPMTELSFSADNPTPELKPAAAVWQRLVSMSQTLDTAHPWTFTDAKTLDEISFSEWFAKNYPNLDSKNATFITHTLESYMGSMRNTSVLNVLTYIKMSNGLAHYADMKYWLRAEGGMGAIAEKIATDLEKNPHVTFLLHHPVYRVNQSEHEVTVYSPNTHIAGSYVIMATPPIANNGIHFDQLNPNSIAQAGPLDIQQRIPMQPAYKAMFVYPSPFWRKQGLSGHIVASEAPIGTVWDASPQDSHVGCLVLSTTPFLGSSHLADMSQEERKQVLLNSLGQFLGEQARHPINFVEKMWDADSFSLGSIGVPSIGAWTQLGQYLRQPMGRVYWASSERALESWAQIDGAVESGQRVGKMVVQNLQNMNAIRLTHLKNYNTLMTRG